MDKLKAINLNPLLLHWIKSYLSGRSQQVLVKGEKSDPLPVLSGVPQGSIIGPLLFLTYIDGIKTTPLSGESHLTLHADDMLLYRPITSIADYALLQQDIDNISNWVDKNYLQFNVQKCKFMHITRKTKCSKAASHLTLYGQPLEKVNTYKYLGLLLSSDLSWTQHINNICTKAKKLLGLIYRRFYQFSTPASLFQMYISLVRPNLEYASQVWSPYKVGEVNSLEHVQKFALRMCTKSWDTSYQELLQLFSLPDLQQRRLYLDLCTMFRIINGLFYFPNDVFVHQTSSIITHGHNTRASTIQGRVQPSLACTPVVCVPSKCTQLDVFVQHKY